MNASMPPAPVPPSPLPLAQRAEPIFLAAVEVTDLQARAALIATRCAGDDALQSEVEALLRAHDRPGFLSGPLLVTPRVEAAGDRIGRYRLLQEIGQGGFGTVWMAEQVEPVTRRVALKVLKLGMDTREVVARFEQERQALAMMDHPNIARVFDAGATDGGRPFFVMELVRGMPITQFCDQRQLGTHARLRLFSDLCGAIHHAHQKGIIHRDIKPSNVLVTLHGDQAVVKVIDFGIAKAMQGRLTDKTLFTRFEQFVGTPVYMAPEQAVLSGLDVDTRCDIYALGMLLYELLTGVPAFDEKTLIAGGWQEMLRMIREVEPPRPSRRLSTIAGDERSAVAKARHTDAAGLSRVVEPDLDWIVMKAIEKDRGRRYESANGLALDVQRFLADEPVTATPPSAGYRFRKFARRHRTAVRAAVCLVVVLLTTSTVSTWLLFCSLDAERAERAARRAAQASEARAIDEAKKSGQTSIFLQSVLTGLDAAAAEGRDPGLLQDLLMRALRRSVEELHEQPEVHLQVLDTIGRSTEQLGLVAHACEIARIALRVGEAEYGSDDPRTARLLTVAARRSLAYGRHEDAMTMATRAVGILRRTVGGEHADTLAATSDLGAVLVGIGEPKAGESVLRDHEAIAARALPADDPATVTGRMRLASALALQQRHGEAEQVLRAALASSERTMGANASRTAELARLLLEELRAQGKLDEALTFARTWFATLHAGRAEHAEAVRMGHALASLVPDGERGEVLRAALELGWRVLGARHFGCQQLTRELLAWYEDHGLAAEADALRQTTTAEQEQGLAARLETTLLPLRTRLIADPTDAHTALRLAARLAWLQRTDEWATTARTILANVAGTLHAPTADRAAKAALLLPATDAAMIAQARTLARRALAQDADSVLQPWFAFCVGLAEFRAGNDGEAEAQLAAVRLEGPYTNLAVVPIVRAMAALRQARPDDARALLHDAKERMRPLPADPEMPFAKGGDHDDLITWLLWREAEALAKAPR
jgi:serine/threonine protein kinase